MVHLTLTPQQRIPFTVYIDTVSANNECLGLLALIMITLYLNRFLDLSKLKRFEYKKIVTKKFEICVENS